MLAQACPKTNRRKKGLFDPLDLKKLADIRDDICAFILPLCHPTSFIVGQVEG